MTDLKKTQVRLSVIVAAWNDNLLLRECLSSIRNQNDQTDTEVIVVSNFKKEISEIEKDFPFADVYVLPRETTVPLLRSIGVNRANGAIIALIEDFCRLDSAWIKEIKQAHKLPHMVIGGAVENTNDSSALGWAVYLFDYGRFMLPVRQGVTASLSGANVSYKREILDSLREKYKSGFYETIVHDEIKNHGYELYLAPSAVVYHNKNYDFQKTVFRFFHQARSFAARRVFNFSISKRLMFSAVALFLPALFLGRVMMQIAGKKVNLKRSIASFPFLMLLTGVWAAGELCGYLSGKGESENHWR